MDFYQWKKFDVKENTIKGYDLMLRQFCVYMRDCELEAVKLGDIMGMFELMTKLGWDKNSFLPRAMALKKFFEFFYKQGHKVIDPWLIPIPDKEFTIPRVISEESYKILIDSIPRNNDPRNIRNLAYISLLWDTGARNNELLMLDIESLDLQERKAVIYTAKAKNSPVREIFWTQTTNQYIIDWLKKRESLQIIDHEALFISVCGTNIGYRLSNKGVCEMMRRYSIRAKLPYQNAHSFRHHMGHDLAMKGANNSTISNILGHSSLQSSFVYTKMHGTELHEIYRKYKDEKHLSTVST